MQGCICQGGLTPNEKWLTLCIVYKNSKGVNFNSSDDPSCLFEIVSMQHCVIVPTMTKDSDSPC